MPLVKSPSLSQHNGLHRTKLNLIILCFPGEYKEFTSIKNPETSEEFGDYPLTSNVSSSLFQLRLSGLILLFVLQAPEQFCICFCLRGCSYLRILLKQLQWLRNFFATK